MRLIASVLFALALCSLSIATFGCSPKKSRPVSIVVSGDTKGWITPCGCAANQSGGLARRATLLKGLSASQEVLILDAGGSASGTTEYHEIKLISILKGCKEMGLDYHNLGTPEIQMQPHQLARASQQSQVKWLSANLRPVDTNSNLAISKVEVFVRGGLRIAVTGVIDPKYVRGNDAWKVRDAGPAILESFETVSADVRVVLAYFDEPGLKELATSLPEVDFLIGGPTGQAMQPVQVGKVRILSATNKGKFLAQAQINFVNGKKWEAGKVGPLEIVSQLNQDLGQNRNVSDYLSILADRDFSASEAGIVTSLPSTDSKYRIAGSESCVKCHAEDQASWHASKHGHAWEVLVAKKSQVDPYCQQCHTTGYGMEGGFVKVAESLERVNVGCENCHGPSAAHVANPKIKTTYPSREQCVRCHDHENSPKFAYDLFWPKIVHGTKKEPVP